MKVLMAGSSGLIGTEVAAALEDRGHEVIRLVRSEEVMEEDTLLWDPKYHEIDPEDFEGFDVVINLGGENIASGHWTEEKKKKIDQSRVLRTHMLSELLAHLENPPKLLINASAIGYYGNRGEETLTEDAEAGDGFLADVCQRWEEATAPAKEKGVRVANLRIGVVLSTKGGALSKMLFPFKFGLGGVAGEGTQYMSWVAIDDVVGMIFHIIGNETLEGPINVVSPMPVTNREFTKTLGTVLRRPTIFPLPAFVARLVMGEMADETVLCSSKVVPKKMEDSHYTFLYPNLKEALRAILGKA